MLSQWLDSFIIYKKQFFDQNGIDFQSPFSYIYSGPVNIFVANFVEIDPVVFSSTLRTDI